MAVFELPLAHGDFQQTQNITDALHSLQRLDETTSSIFARLLSRIGHETEVRDLGFVVVVVVVVAEDRRAKRRDRIMQPRMFLSPVCRSALRALVISHFF